MIYHRGRARRKYSKKLAQIFREDIPFISWEAHQQLGDDAHAAVLGRGAVPRLRALDLGHNPFECAGARALADGLRALAALESLRVPRAYLYEIDALVRASPAPLRVLVLDGNGLDGDLIMRIYRTPDAHR